MPCQSGASMLGFERFYGPLGRLVLHMTGLKRWAAPALVLAAVACDNPAAPFADVDDPIVSRYSGVP